MNETGTRDPGELVSRHQTTVWAYLRYLGCDAATADDLTQDTFISLLSGSFEDRGTKATNALLRRIARCHHLRRLRGETRRAARERAVSAEAPWLGAKADLGVELRVEALRQCLEQLDGRSRQMVEDVHLDGLPTDKAAAKLSMTGAALRTALHRARERLRQCIERRLAQNDHPANGSTP